MHRPIVILLTLATLLVPAGAANEEDPYYVKVVFTQPEVDGRYDAARDCAGPNGPRDALGSADHLVGQVGPPFNPLGGPSLEGTVPRCVVFDSRVPGACGSTACFQVRNSPHATFAYELGSGNYSARVFLPIAFTRMNTDGPDASGSTGLGVLFDCWNCPPP